MRGAIAVGVSVLVMALGFVCRAADSEPSERLVVVISDLHLGVGRDAGDWHPFEDFRWADEFAAFLRDVDARGRGETTLVINGDAFELWQAIETKADGSRCSSARGERCDGPTTCSPSDKSLGCSLSEAGARLQRVLDEHEPELAALGAFAAKGDNRVVFVPGNHDATLLWPELAAKVVAKVVAPAGRVTVNQSGYWRSRSGEVFAEHGHEIGKDPNRFCDEQRRCLWPAPFVTRVKDDGTPDVRMIRPWGEAMVQEFFNRYEETYPIIDNFASEGMGLQFGLAKEGVGGVLRGIVRFATFLLTGESLGQFSQFLDKPGQPVEWRIDVIRQGDLKEFVALSFDDQNPLRAAIRSSDEQVTLTDAEIRAACTRREVVRSDLPEDRKAEVPPCPRKEENLRYLGEKLVGERNGILAKHLSDRADSLRSGGQLGENGPFSIFVYSHTHKVEWPYRPFDGRTLGTMPTTVPETKSLWDPIVVNSGAWQRVVYPDQVATLRQRAKDRQKDVLELRPEDLPACYSAVLINMTQRPLQPELLWWHKSIDRARWELVPAFLAPECAQRPAKD